MIMTPCCIDEGESSYPRPQMMMELSETLTRDPLILDKFLATEDSVIRTRPSSTSSAAIVNKKRVAFNQQVHVRTTIAYHAMSQQEKDSVWYSAEECREITESCCNQIIKLDRGEALEDKKDCARGLESQTHIRSLAKIMNRDLAQKVVFNEQERQWQQGVCSAEALSQVYLAACSGSCMWANVIGLEDQKEADNIYDEGTRR